MKKRLLHNNRGASLVSVIIAMTVVAVLGVTIMFVAYSNLNMKIVDRKSKDNFYTAESVLDEIVAGLQTEMANQFENAYTETMSGYGSYASLATMKDEFKTEYVLDMVDELHASESEGLYNVALLDSYVTGTYPGTYAVGCDKTEGTDNLLETLSDGLILRNVKVTYTENNYENTIVTDIKLAVPQVEFSLISSMPKIADFSYVADDGIAVNGGVTLILNGNAYSGTASSTDSSSLTLAAGSTFDASSNVNGAANATELLIVGGDAELVGASTLKTSGSTALWCDGVTCDVSVNTASKAGNTLELLGRTYVADDITLNGSENNLTLGGEYYGYTYGANNADSSAIVINGLKSKVNMSALDTLVVSGTAYVASSKVASGDKDKTNAKDVQTGESIAVKSNQIAYLVPTKCAGITSNPMSYTQYEKLITNSSWISDALSTELSSLKNRTLYSYASSTDKLTITPVFSSEQGGTVYLFLNFTNAAEAAAYFMDVYGTEDSLVADYMQKYLESFEFPVKTNADQPDLELVTGGNYLLPGTFDTNTLSWTTTDGAAYSETYGTVSSVTSELDSYASTYRALCAKLVTSGVTTTEASKGVFENLIDSTEISTILAKDEDDVNNGAVLDSKVLTFTGSGVQAIIVDNAGTSAYVVDSNNNTLPGIILATGDVQVKGNWSGVIICDGVLTVANNATLSSDEEAVGNALRLNCKAGTDTCTVANFFIGGENYSASSSNDTGEIDVRNCVTYENWKSE